MPIRSRMSLIMGQIEPEHPELFALEFGKIAEYDFVDTLIIYKVKVKGYMTITSWMSLIMKLIGPELSELSAFE